VALELVYEKIKKGPEFGKSSHSPINLVEELLKENKKVVEIDSNENISDFNNGFSIVITSLKDIQNDKEYELRSEKLPKILAEWDDRIRNIVHSASLNTGIIVCSGVGDVELAEL
jgi:hypothetical protein